VGVIKDQTIYEQLVKEKLQEKSQRMLLSSISHEIRNPLNGIYGYMATIQDSNDFTEIKAISKKIEYEVERVELIVSSACDLIMTENKMLILQPEKIDIPEAIQQVINMFQSEIDAKNLKVEILIRQQNIPPFFTDAKKFKQILFHLLTNAVKYTSVGSINISAEYDEALNKLCTTVNDTGIGMSVEVIQKLFHLYANIDKANAYNPQGMGFGLTLCKKLCSIMEGDITATSELGKGSTFIFSIKNFENRNIEKEVLIEEAGGKQMKELKVFVPQNLPVNRPSRMDVYKGEDILIVDDEPTNRVILKAYIKTFELGSEEAGNGKIALDKVRERGDSRQLRYKLILMDINMPIMDGTEATQKLIQLFTEQPKLQTPIIAVTAANFQTRTDIQNLLSVGFCDICKIFIIIYVVQKPVSKATFIQHIKPYIY
jgi:CheY-like chemotaxis protein